MGNKSFEELTAIIDTAKKDIPVGSLRMHYKGDRYIILDVTFESDSEEIVIVYGQTDLHPEIHFTRTLDNFLLAVEHKGGLTPRFTRIS